MIFKEIMIFCEIATRFVEFAKMHPTDKNELKIAIKWYFNLHKSKEESYLQTVQKMLIGEGNHLQMA